MGPVKGKTTPKATVAIKVIRADGTEESFVSEDVSVTDAGAVAKLIEDMSPGGDPTAVTPEEVEQRNAEESRRNAEANRRVAEAAQREGQ